VRVLEYPQNEGNLKTRVVESLLPSWLDLWFLPFWSGMMLAQDGFCYRELAAKICVVFFFLELDNSHGPMVTTPRLPGIPEAVRKQKCDGVDSDSDKEAPPEVVPPPERPALVEARARGQ